MIDAVGVVVPVHDEAACLDACLASIEAARAALAPSLRCVVVVVLDTCTDASAQVARAWASSGCVGPRERVIVERAFENVGRARAAGMAALLEELAAYDPARVWLATTDADSCVPDRWLVDQLAMAARGAQAFAGTIEVTDWSEQALGMESRFRAFYEPPGAADAHDHVHGANLGLRADAYAASGGFQPLATGEDHALWNALSRDRRPRVSSRTNAVTTSARRVGRAPLGFSTFLERMAAAHAHEEA